MPNFDLGGYSDFDWSQLGNPVSQDSGYYDPGFNLGNNQGGGFDFNNLNTQNDWQTGAQSFFNNPAFQNLTQSPINQAQSFDIPGSNPGSFGGFPSNPPAPQIEQPGLLGDSTPRSALDDFREHIQSMPSRDDYRPSKMRILGGVGLAAGMGMHGNIAGGLKTGEEFLNKPYADAISDWTTKGKGLEKLSDDQRMTDYQKGIVGARNDLNKVRAEKAPAEIKALMSKAGLSDARTQDILDGKTQLVKTRDGYVLVNTKTKETTPTGFDDKTMTPEEKLDFQKVIDQLTTARQLKVTAAQGTNQQALEGTRQQNRQTNIETNFENRKEAVDSGMIQGVGPNKKTVGDPNAVKSGSPAEQRLRTRAFNDAVARNYTKYASILDQTQDGRYVINPEKATANKSVYEDLMNHVNFLMGGK